MRITGHLVVYGITVTTTLSCIHKFPQKISVWSVSQCQAQRAMSSKAEASWREAVWGLHVGDALAMPVHWYYNPGDIKTGYGGWLTGYRAPNQKHPSSILTLSAMDGSGRKGWHKEAKPIIGHVILHDKLQYWTSGKRTTHYHQGMQAGDNTLNAITALKFLETMKRVDPDSNMAPRDLRAAVIEDYVKFMTTPGSHDDTYAESFHRLFFKDWAALENPPKSGADILDFCDKRYKNLGREDSQIAAIGGLVLTVPWVVHYAGKSSDECARHTVEALRMTHPAPSMEQYVELYSHLLHAVINGADAKAEILKTLTKLGKKDMIQKLSLSCQRYPAGSEERLEAYQSATYSLGSACYIDGAMATMLFLAHEFYRDFEAGVLNNANCGGENAHRGAALGALLGAASIHQGAPIPRKWKEGLHSAKHSLQSLLEQDN